jgi:hypothetical protein
MDMAAPVEPVAAPIPMDGDVGLVRVRQAWPRVLRHIKDVQRKNLLIGTLREAEVVSVEGNAIHLGFDPKWKFHVQSVQQPGNVEIISRACEAVLGRKFNVKAAVSQATEPELMPAEDVVEESAPPPSEAPDTNMVQDVLEMFGGRVVENTDEVN